MQNPGVIQITARAPLPVVAGVLPAVAEASPHKR